MNHTDQGENVTGPHCTVVYRAACHVAYVETTAPRWYRSEDRMVFAPDRVYRYAETGGYRGKVSA